MAVKNYPVAVLIGDYGDDAEMSNALREYVSGGGTLVLNSAQMTPSLSWARGGTPVRRVGKGTVILTEEPYWCPWTDGERPETGVNIMGITKSYPAIAKTFDGLLARLYPVRVVGEVQYGFNRLADGWQVYLINNGGVTKFGDKAETFDPKGAEVELDLASLGGAVTATELFSGERLKVRGGKARLVVPSGDLRIVDIVP